MSVALYVVERRALKTEKEETTMIPATFPGLPVTLFPGLLVPSIMTGEGVVDLTAAIAVLAWGFGGLIALRIALAMSRDKSPRPSTTSASPTHPHGFRDAA
jgi:hypothetical protein